MQKNEPFFVKREKKKKKVYVYDLDRYCSKLSSIYQPEFEG